MSTKFVDVIDPFLNKATIKSRKQKKSQSSSHFKSKGPAELQALPLLKGTFDCFVILIIKQRLWLLMCVVQNHFIWVIFV
jgi:hypothetical protein